MKKILFAIILIIIALNLNISAQDLPKSDSAIIEEFNRNLERSMVPIKMPDHVPGQFIIAFKDDVSLEEAEELIKKYELAWEPHFPKMFSCWVKVIEGPLSDHLNLLKKNGIVLGAESRGKNGGDSKRQYILIQFNIKATKETAEQLIKSVKGLEMDSYSPEMKWGVVRVPGDKKIKELLEIIKKEPIVKYVELDFIYNNDPR